MLSLKAEQRDIFGKKLQASRKEGKLPVVLYGKGMETSPLFVALNSFKKALKEAGESTVLELETAKGKENVLIHSVDFDPVNHEPVHADFYKVDMKKVIQVGVPLSFVGIAPAVKDLSGVLVKVLHELEIEALPAKIPHEIQVSIEKLKTFQDQIIVSDIVLPEGVKSLAEADEVVALVEEPKDEPVEEQPAMDLSQIEVEKKGKKEEEGESAEG